jgi:hypothetical protein
MGFDIALSDVHAGSNARAAEMRNLSELNN